MIYVTGDIHGDLTRFKSKKLKKLKKSDYLIVCGDFGFLWSGDKKENRILKKLGKMKYSILFVEGCHENYDLLYKYPQQPWQGGYVRAISGRLKQLIRGNVFEIDGVKIFAFGGGHNDEYDIRKDKQTYWEQELPTSDELIFAINNLNRNQSEVDYIITHEPPAKVADFIDAASDVTDHNHLGTFFDEMTKKCSYKKWCFGKIHKNKIVPPRFHGLYDDVIKLETPPLPKKKRRVKD